MKKVKLTKKFIEQVSKELGGKIKFKNQFKSGMANPIYPISVNGKEYVMKLYSKKRLEMFKINVKVYDLFKNEKLITKVIQSGNWGDGKYLVMKKIEGKDFSEIDVGKLSQKELNKIGFDMGTIVAIFHSTKNSKFGKLCSSKYKTWEAYLSKMNGRRLKSLKGYDFESYIPKIRKYFKNNGGLIKDIKKGSFVHDDLQAENFIIHENKLNGVIDFDGAFWGDPMFELSYVGTRFDYFFEINGKDYNQFIKNFYKGYESVRELNWKKYEKVKGYYYVCKFLKHLSGFPSLKKRVGGKLGMKIKKHFIEGMDEWLGN